jgi:hypothetical protein
MGRKSSRTEHLSPHRYEGGPCRTKNRAEVVPNRLLAMLVGASRLLPFPIIRIAIRLGARPKNRPRVPMIDIEIPHMEDGVVKNFRRMVTREIDPQIQRGLFASAIELIGPDLYTVEENHGAVQVR